MPKEYARRLDRRRSLRLFSRRPPWPVARPRIEREIELEHVHPGLAEQAEQSALGVLGDQAAHDALVQLACPGHAADLIEGGRRADVRIEAAARGGDEIHGHRRRV